MSIENRAPSYRAAFWCAAAVIGFLQIWSHRFDVNPDGISYIEMAWSAVRHGPSGLLNGYWSPLYPFLIGVVFRLFRPGPAGESSVVHLLNFVIFLCNLACFELFLAELLRNRDAVPGPSESRRRIPSGVIWIWGYVFFLWACQVWLTPALVTPDLCVAALCYLAVALLLRIRRKSSSSSVAGNWQQTWKEYGLLGIVLGLAYLAKAFMFPLAFVFLACAFFAARPSAAPWRSRTAGSNEPRQNHPWAHLAVAALIFFAISAPLVINLSRTKGRLTFGDSGSLNYAWYVDRVPGPYWQGAPSRSGVPTHPLRQILERPAVFEFASPVAGSYPPTYDPSYWDEGLHSYFSWRGQVRVLARSASFFLQMFSRTGALYVTFLILFWVLQGTGRWQGSGPKRWFVWFPAYAAMGLYTLVQVDQRFIGQFALMLLLGLFASVQPEKQRLDRRLACVALAMVVAPVVSLIWSAGKNASAIERQKPAAQFQVATELSGMEITEGSRVATIGAGAGSYWAHLAGVRIVSEVASPAEFWSEDMQTRQKVMTKFAELGVLVVVTEGETKNGRGRPGTFEPSPGWHRAGDTNFYLYRLLATDSKTTPGN